MLCERCKMREANIQYTEVINGVKTEHNFCAECAKELDFGQYSAIFDGEFPLGKLLSGLLSGENISHKQDKRGHVTCPTCGSTYEEFVKDSRFGCADCYGVFDLLISDSIKQLQGSDNHTGKVPLHQDLEKSAETADQIASGEVHSVEMEIRILDAKLQDALKKEEYDMAARYRDQIKALKAEASANE